LPTAAASKVSALADIAGLEEHFGRLKMKVRHASYGVTVEPEEYAEFNSRCFIVIDRLSTRDDIYYIQALHELDVHKTLTSAALALSLHGLIQSLKRDIQAGSSTSWHQRAHTEVLAGFLFQAESLLNQGAKDAAAVILGSVLASHLRLLAMRHDFATRNTSEDGPNEPAAVPLVRVSDALARYVYTKDDHRRVVGG
jgi:hypothetical protein